MPVSQSSSHACLSQAERIQLARIPWMSSVVSLDGTSVHLPELTELDRRLINSPVEMLNDNVIAAAAALLQHQFGHIDGLEETTLAHSQLRFAKECKIQQQPVTPSVESNKQNRTSPTEQILCYRDNCA